MERLVIFFLNMSNFMLLLDVAICFGVPEMCVDDIPDDGMLTKHNLLYSSLSKQSPFSLHPVSLLPPHATLCFHLSPRSHAKVNGRVYLIINRWVLHCFLSCFC